ncbi:M20 family metallopeptidase [Collinsella sp. UBA1693]|uniref:M20 family metallopeptidase n=1 Tax=Collinsella sp. UBA1693 TaxID=1946385 RepID=UPI00257BA913|nr:M20 family metallopeptidase [Collinsella sp. UBA1693]
MPACLVKHISIKELEVFPTRRNLNVTVAGYGSAPNLVYICHMDTVTLGEGWSTDTPALGATVRENRLYGRGACDMKGGLACALSALFSLMDAMEHTGTQPERGFSLICTVDEEANMRGVEAAIDAGWVGTDEWVLDTEPTDNQIQVAHKGRTWFELDIKGVTAHASQPWEGADAVAATAEAISHIRRSIEALPHHAELGASTVTFGMVQGGYQPYVVPDACTTWIDMRLVPPATTAKAETIVQDAIERAQREVAGIQGAYRITGDRPPIERDSSSPLLAALSKTVEQTTGAPAQVSYFTGYTDTAVIAGTRSNHNCMSYGPGSLALAHKPNEWVPRDDIQRVEAVLTDLLLSQSGLA